MAVGGGGGEGGMRKGRNEDERSRDKFRTEQGQQMMEKDVTGTDRGKKNELCEWRIDSTKMVTAGTTRKRLETEEHGTQ